jgi:hypothetical protein
VRVYDYYNVKTEQERERVVCCGLKRKRTRQRWGHSESDDAKPLFVYLYAG